MPRSCKRQDERLLNNRILPPIPRNSGAGADATKNRFDNVEKDENMREKKSNRTRIIGLRLTRDEYVAIEKRWKESTCRKLSDYVRNHLFNRSIVTTYRNLSLDASITELSLLRTELNRIGTNFNQSVRRLNSMKEIAEFRIWIARYEVEKTTIMNKIEDIKKHIHNLASTWSQS